MERSIPSPGAPGLAALVLVPGLLCDEALWAPQIAGLADCARPWVPDLAACATLEAAIGHILSACPFPRFSMAGLSMGGYLAAAVALRAPQRVERLALLNTRAHSPDTPAAIERRGTLIALAEQGRFDEVLARLLPSLLSGAALADAALAGAVERMSRRLGAEVFVRQQRANMGREDISARISDIRCPTLVIAGSVDAIAPAAAVAELAGLLPQAQLQVLAGCGHLSTLERPEEVNALLRAWLQCGPAPAMSP